MLNRTCQKSSDSAVECKGRWYQVKVMRSFTKEATCAKIGKEIWKQSSLGIPRHKLDKGFYGRLSQPRYWQPMFNPHRLLVWGIFKCHVSKDTKDSLKRLKVDQAVISGGCTGFIQAPDVCWNKPFKDSYTKSYSDWFEAEKQEFTAAGNSKSAPLEVLVGWIVKVWDSISNDIVNSFKVCSLTNNLHWSKDEQIIIFKDKKCCAGCLKEFWDQLDSKAPAVNIEVGHEKEINQNVNNFVDFNEDFYIIVEKDS